MFTTNTKSQLQVSCIGATNHLGKYKLIVKVVFLYRQLVCLNACK